MLIRPKSIIYLFDTYTLLIWAWLVLEFFSKSELRVPTSLTTVYLVILGIYVGDKEFERLRKRYSSRQLHGERFVLLWVMTLIAISIVIAFFHNGYHMPGDLPVVTACVLILWLASEYVKKNKK
jgi:peptidoglycan/LPS O-acetylase OafA/YrhL